MMYLKHLSHVNSYINEYLIPIRNITHIRVCDLYIVLLFLEGHIKEKTNATPHLF